MKLCVRVPKRIKQGEKNMCIVRIESERDVSHHRMGRLLIKSTTSLYHTLLYGIRTEQINKTMEKNKQYKIWPAERNRNNRVRKKQTGLTLRFIRTTRNENLHML